MDSNPWAVTSEQPAQQNSPTPAAPTSEWSVVGQSPAKPAANSTPTTEPTAMQKATDSSHDPDWIRPVSAFGGGMIKSAAGLVGNILDLTNRFNQKVQPGVTAQHPEAVKHIQDAADWLKSGGEPQGFWENIGAVGEQVLEYLGTDGLLKLVSAPAQAAGATSAAVRTGEQLKNAQQVSAVLAKNPRLAGLLAVGLKASKDATLMAGQTYLHTEDPEQAALAGAAGGALRTAGEGVAAVGKWVNKVRPRTLEIAGEKIPALATQVNEAGKPIPSGAAAAPAIAEAQQQAAPKVVQNIAQNATRSALERINTTRPVYTATEDAGRMLPAPEGSQPFTFSIEGAPRPTEEPTGKIAHKAGKVQQPAAFPPKYTTASGPEPIAGSEGTSGADVSTARPAEARGENVKGGGALQTTNPQEAESWLRQIEDIQQSPLHDAMSPSQQSALEAQRKQLSEQLGLYHSSPYAQRFAPVDIEGATNQVRSFGDAADQIQASAKPIYAELDRASNGEFNKWNGAAKQALKIMRSATSMDAYTNAEQHYQEATRAIDDLLTRHAGNVSRTDYQAAKMAWRDSSRLNELHTVMERMMNGITLDESDQGFTRVMTGRSKQLQAYLDKGQNTEQIRNMIGDEGLRNLKQLTELMGKAQTQRGVVDVLRNVATELGRHARLGGIGGFVGGIAAHQAGLPWFEGVAAGAAAGSVTRALMRDAMTNPRIGNLVDYAVRNNLNPKIYAPLIARVIATPLQEQSQEDSQR